MVIFYFFIMIVSGVDVCVCFCFLLIGLLYVGMVCMVLYNWVYVCYNGGKMVFCIEDIDVVCDSEESFC